MTRFRGNRAPPLVIPGRRKRENPPSQGPMKAQAAVDLGFPVHPVSCSCTSSSFIIVIDFDRKEALDFPWVDITHIAQISAAVALKLTMERGAAGSKTIFGHSPLQGP